MNTAARLHTQQQRLFGSSALVLQWRGPQAWAYTATVWEGVQSAWQWPAPAIAVNGVDGYQLWFGLQTPVSSEHAHAWSEAVFARWTPEAPTHQRARLEATPCPPMQDARTGQWAAFVTPGLAPVFAETPWLDDAPNAEGQADVLSGLQTVPADAWAAALQTASAAPLAPATSTDPRAFLLAVMNDASVEMGLRIQAAKALL